MNKLSKRLLDLKEKIENSKAEKNKIEGRLQELMSRLKREFKINTIAEARRLLTKLEKEKEKLEQEVKEGIQKLEEKYEW